MDGVDINPLPTIRCDKRSGLKSQRKRSVCTLAVTKMHKQPSQHSLIETSQAISNKLNHSQNIR